MTAREWKAFERLVAILKPGERAVLIRVLGRQARELAAIAPNPAHAADRLIQRRVRELKAMRDYAVEMPGREEARR
ncbi:hypothetical protein [Anaeromyxobacter dehalogenans]|nr:hypothetical protein [Anaeromyxobacter dehalogenans]